MGKNSLWSWNALIWTALPLIALGLFLLTIRARPWWLGVGIFGAGILLDAAFFATRFLRLQASRRAHSIYGALQLGAASVGVVMGIVSIWLAVSDLMNGQLNEVEVSVSHLLPGLGLAIFVLTAAAVAVESS